MKVDFTGKIAVVTGGAAGMGAALCRILHDAGARVVIADLDEAGGAALATELGGDARFMRVDVASEDDTRALAEKIGTEHGRLDAVFNNAGIPNLADAEALEPDIWRRVIDVNLTSAYLMVKALVPLIRAGGRGGAIVNIASVSGLRADYGMIAYNASKGGLINMTRAMALDYARENIRVNAVCPGVIGDTVMTGGLRQVGIGPWEKAVPMRRLGRAVEVAQAMAFMGSDLASYMTGAVVTVDGGLTCGTGLPNALEIVQG